MLPVLRASLDETADAIGDGERFTALARAFHERLVGCCGNETMILTVGALETLWSEQERQWAQQATSAGTYPGERYRKAVQSAHEALVTAIAQGPGRQSEPARRSAPRAIAALFVEGPRTRWCGPPRCAAFPL